MTSRRLFLGLAASALLAAGCATTPPPSLQEMPPIVFVHGNGDTAALWQTTFWRFESNGWPRDRLHAIDVPYPLSRDDDGKAQPGRTSTAEHMAYLKAEIDKVLAATGARQVVLVGNSRGGYAIRNYVKNGGNLVIVHAANNAFADWPEFNAMIGLGGWGGDQEHDSGRERGQDGGDPRGQHPANVGRTSHSRLAEVSC